MLKKWWHNTIGYQIYPKSYQDTNGDGIGDIRGVIQHLDDLLDLGINVIWLCPIYQSPMVDHGYDISDYDRIDPMFGSNEEMEELIREADKRGMKILMDLVVNHTSDQHEWFQKAMADLDSEYADFYIIREGDGENPPNNWRSIFGGSAWEKIGDTNKYYLHLFTKGQPDLNWENPKLREIIYDMVNRWLDIGLGGFRIDAISHLKKNFAYVNRPADGPDGLASAWDYFRNAKGLNVFLDELKEKTFKPHNAFTIGEVDDVRPEELGEFIGDDGYFSTIFDFCHTQFHVKDKEWKDCPLEMIHELRDRLFAKQDYAKGHGLMCNFTDNHDTSRSVERFIPEEHINFYSESLLASVNFFLRGIVFLYQGQEIGMRDYQKKSIHEFLDLATYNNYNGYLLKGMTEDEALEKVNNECREHSRTPMQWNDKKNAGFTEGIPWFDVNPNYRVINYEAQKKDDKSLLSYYKKMIALRKREDLEETFIYGETKPRYEDQDGVIAYERTYEENRVLAIHNCNAREIRLPLDDVPGEVLLNNYEDWKTGNDNVVLKAFQSVIVKLK